MTWSFLQIRDGFFESDRLVGTYCGTDGPPTFISSTNTLHVVFRTDGDTGDAGFTLQYEAVNSESYTIERARDVRFIHVTCLISSNMVRYIRGTRIINMKLYFRANIELELQKSNNYAATIRIHLF